MPFILVLALVFAFACGPPPAVAPPAADAFASRIVVQAAPVPLNPADPAQMTIGRLRYMGGLHLTSPDPRFGGLSGLRWHEGRLFAVSDEGDFFLLTLEERDGWLTGIRDARMQRLTRLDGTLLSGKAESDAEALEVVDLADPAPQAIVSFEGTNRLWRYALVDGMPRGAPAELDWAADWRRRLPGSNGGVESMADGWLLAEELREPDGQVSGRRTEWEGEGGGCYTDGPPARQTAARARETPMNLPVAPDFAPTDADAVPGGGAVYVLQRRYVPGRGNTARIVRLRPAEDCPAPAAPGQATGPEMLAEIDVPLTVDNFEGLAYRGTGGDYLYIVSDNNFSPNQRTLLLKFQVID